MRLAVLLFTATLAAAPAVAQTGQDRPQPSTAPDAGDAAQTSSPPGGAAPLDLPVSLDRIRERLENPPAKPLHWLDDKPVFKVRITEKQRFDELVSRLKFDKGPQVPGGLYAYEQQQTVWSKQQNAEMLPYGAFNQSQLATILFEQFLQKYLGSKIVGAFDDASRARAEAAAREEVQQALADFWAYQARQAAIQPPLKP